MVLWLVLCVKIIFLIRYGGCVGVRKIAGSRYGRTGLGSGRGGDRMGRDGFEMELICFYE